MSGEAMAVGDQERIELHYLRHSLLNGSAAIAGLLRQAEARVSEMREAVEVFRQALAADAADEKLVEELKRDEGLRLEVYLCPAGFPTVGYGHRVALGDPIDEASAEALLRFDVRRTRGLFEQIPREYREKLNDVRERVILNMIFQHGLRGVMLFRKMWAAIREGDFERAAAEIMDSNSGRRFQARMGRLAELMRRGSDS